MRHKLLFAILFIILGSLCQNFYTHNFAEAKETQHWEYLIVSYGKVIFSDIESNVKIGSSKLTAFSEFSNLLNGSEAVSIQKQIDILGRLDWELVDIVGSIGGDQQFVFKRKHDKKRTQAEKKFAVELKGILEEEAEEREAILKALERERALLYQNKKKIDSKKLVDLDQIEKEQREINAYNSMKKRINIALSNYQLINNELLNNATIQKINFTGTCYEASYGSSKGNMSGNMKIEMLLDASSTLIRNENQYRRSEVENLAEACVDKIEMAISSLKIQKTKYSFSLDKNFSINIRVKLKLKNQFDEIFVSASSKQGFSNVKF